MAATIPSVGGHSLVELIAATQRNAGSCPFFTDHEHKKMAIHRVAIMDLITSIEGCSMNDAHAKAERMKNGGESCTYDLADGLLTVGYTHEYMTHWGRFVRHKYTGGRS